MKRINIKQTINSWDEGIPLGCGKLGSIVYGSSPLKITVDRTDLWDLRPNETTLERDFCFKSLVKLSKSGKAADWEERERLFEKIYDEKPYPSKITAGRMELDFREEPKNVESVLDLKTAVASFYDGERKLLEIFNDANRFIGVMRVYGDFCLRLRVPTYLSKSAASVGKYNFDYPMASIKKDTDFIWYEQNTHTDYTFGIVAFQKRYTKYTEIYYTIAVGYDKNCFECAKQELQLMATIGYDTLQKEHKKWWNSYWSKSSVNVGDTLLEDVYYKSWYLFASCSRKGFYPMSLQGVWTADNDALPPWRGDYHHDTNTQLSYQAYLKANHLKEGEVFIDYLWNLKEVFKKFAKEFFGVNGLLIPSCSTLDGKAMGGWAQYSLSPTMTIWTAQSFDEYWLYTGNESFLKTRAYPFFKEVGNAIYGLLEERNGKLYLPLSSSPEIFDDTQKAYLEPNSNFDLALIRYLYATLICYCKHLGKDTANYEEILDKLDDIHVQNEKFVMLDYTQKLEESHRHFSHLMCMYPLHLINYDTEKNRKIYDCSIAEIERLGTGMWVGFSFAMSAQIYAMAYKGNAAYEKLYQFANGFVAENGFHLNGDFKHFGYSTFHYRPFTLESSFGFCDALHEMLLQDHQGFIELFPAIPDNWKERKIGFKNLLSRGGVRVSATLLNGKITKLVLKAPKKMRVRLKGSFNAINVLQQKGVISYTDDILEVEIEKGKIEFSF